MKRALIFAFSAMLLCVVFCSCHAADESDYFGTWMQEMYDLESGDYTVILLCLTPDHQAYYLNQRFVPEETKFGRSASKTWWMTSNGIHIILGENSETDAIILSDGRLGFALSGNKYSPYTRVSSLIGGADDTEGITIPAGDWTVGVDIPAGVYSAKKPDNITSLHFVVWRGAKNDTSYGFDNLCYNLVLDKKTPMLGKITLEDGNTLVLEDPIILGEPVKIVFPDK